MKRFLPLLLRAAVVLAVSALVVEGAFRYVVFGEGRIARAAARTFPDLRRPQSYAEEESTQYWLLEYQFRGRGRGREARFEPDLGWVNARTDPATLAHADEEALRGRRPALLFGDSFAACYGDRTKVCFQDLLEQSPLAADWGMLNYGTGGYGFGQIAWECRKVVGRFADRDPFVLVGVLVDNDLDRTLMPFRGWPKPQFRRGPGGGAELVPRELPETRDAFLDRYGIGVASYAWSFLKHGTSLWPRAALQSEVAAWREDVCAVNGDLLRGLVADLRARDMEFAFVLFHGRSFLGPEPSRLQVYEDFLVGELEALGAPYVLSWVPVRADAERTGRGEGDYWYLEGGGKGHLTPLGNELVATVLEGALRGEFHGGTTPPAPDGADEPGH